MPGFKKLKPFDCPPNSDFPSLLSAFPLLPKRLPENAGLFPNSPPDGLSPDAFPNKLVPFELFVFPPKRLPPDGFPPNKLPENAGLLSYPSFLSLVFEAFPRGANKLNPFFSGSFTSFSSLLFVTRRFIFTILYKIMIN